MTGLALTLPLNEYETPASYVSRLSRRNQTIPREFCSDLGMRWPHVCSSHADQLERLSYLSRINLEGLKAAGAVLIAQSRYQVGHSQATTGTFRRAVTRICPKCTQEAVERDGPTGPFQKLEWLLLCVGVCRKHNVPLLQLPNAHHAHVTYDVVARVFAHLPEIQRASEEAAHTTPTPFEDYICERALSGPGEDWLTPLDLTGIHRGSLSLGMSMLFGPGKRVSELDFAELRSSMNTGFQVLVAGPEALVAALDDLRRNYRTERPYFSKDIGEFYVWLKSLRNDPSVDAIRACVEEFVLEKYPLQVGKTVLGSAMSAPKFLTLNQVREVHGLGHVRVRGILAHLNRQPSADFRRMKDISLKDLDRVLAYWATLQDLKSAAAALNILPAQVKSLIKLGVLEARSFGTSRRYVKMPAVQALLQKLEMLPEGQPSRLVLPLKAYCRAEKIHLGQVISDWAAGKLQGVSRDIEAPGLQGILVERGEAFQRQKVVLNGDLGLSETARYLRISAGSIRKLRDGGYLDQVHLRNPDTSHRKSYITRQSIKLFQEHYLTLGQMAEQCGCAPIHLARALDREDVEPVCCRSGYVRVYPASAKGKVLEIVKAAQRRAGENGSEEHAAPSNG